MEFKKYRLGEIATFSQGKQVDVNEQYINKRNDMKKFIRIVDYTNTNEPVRYVENYGDRYYASEEELVMIRYGSQTAGMAVMGKNDIIANNLFKINLNNDIVLNKYMYYYLSQKEIYNYLRNSQSSSTMPAISFSIMNSLEIDIPSIAYQNKAINILLKIEKKIELNNKINDNLYKILEQYIKEHYYNNESVLNGIVSNVGKIQGGYAFKSKDLLDEPTNNKIFKIKNISESSVDIENTQCIYDEIAYKVDKKFLLVRGNVIIAMTGAELGKTGYLYGKDYRYFLNQRVGVIRGNDKYSELYLNCLFLLKDMQNTLNSKGYGSAQPNISTSDIENIEIPIPNEDDLKTFYEVCNPIYNKMILNSEQNQSLTQLRDTLLPKLMNGEINIDNIEV